MDYVKDGTLTIQARTIKEVNSIDRVVVYADGCQREYLMPLPTIEERKDGEWIELGQNKDVTHNIMCSVCGGKLKSKGHARSYNTKKYYVFCPRCGAKMKGE